MNTDRPDDSCELENIVVGDGLDEFAQENGEPDTSASLLEIVEAPITVVPAAPPRRAPARLRTIRAAARDLAARAAQSWRQSTTSVRDYVRRQRAAAGAAAARGGAAIASARQRSANALLTGASKVRMHVSVLGMSVQHHTQWTARATAAACREAAALIRASSDRARVAIAAAVLTGASKVSMHVAKLAKSVQHHMRSTAQVTAAVCRDGAALIRASSHRARSAIAAAAITSRRRAEFDFSSLVPTPRAAVGAAGVALLVGVGLLLWRQPAGSPGAAVPTSTTVQDSQPAENSLTARAPAPAVVVPTPAPPAPAPSGTGLRPATPTVAQVAAAPEPEAVYGGTVAVRTEPVRRPAVVRAIAMAAPAEAKPLPEAVTTAAVVVPAAIPAAGGVSALAVAEPRLVEPPSRPALNTVDADRSAIEGILSSYRRSYNSLDAKAVSAIWQGVDTRALARAFSTLTRQQMIFERCNVRVVAADRGAARCDGILSYVQKAGDTTPQQRRVSWEIDFRRPAADWVIVGVQAR